VKSIVICDDAALVAGVTAARRLGVGLEIQQFYDPVVAADGSAIRTARVAAAGLSPLAIHGPFGDLCPGSFDAMIRDATRHRFELGWSVARELNAGHLVLHHGYVPGTTPPPNWITRCAAFWKNYLADKPSALQFHVENMVEHGPELLRDVLEAVAAPNLTACLDLGHAHCHSRTAVVRWVEVLGSRIGYVHVHNNHGESDEHLEPYAGTLDVAEALAAIHHHSPSAVWALEVPLDTIGRSMEWLTGVAGRL
jgi:sugar phosphate isomerase/epimerase